MAIFNSSVRRAFFTLSSVAIYIVLGAGCASNSNFHTARSLGKGNTQGIAGLTLITFGKDSSASLYGLDNFFLLELAAALGVNDYLDIAMKYTFPTEGCVEAKLTFIGAHRRTGVFSALGARVGATAMPKNNEKPIDPNRVDFSVPFYLSYFPTNLFGITVIPTFSGRYYFDSKAYDRFQRLVGCNGNLRLGGKYGMFAEISYYKNLSTQWNELQFGGGLFFQLKEIFTN